MRVVGISADVTDRKREMVELRNFTETLEEAVKARTRELEQSIALIRASESQYRLLFESNPTPIYTYDPVTLRFLAVNDAAALHYGYDKAEFLDMTLKDVALPDAKWMMARRLRPIAAPTAAAARCPAGRPCGRAGCGSARGSGGSRGGPPRCRA